MSPALLLLAFLAVSADPSAHLSDPTSDHPSDRPSDRPSDLPTDLPSSPFTPTSPQTPLPPNHTPKQPKQARKPPPTLDMPTFKRFFLRKLGMPERLRESEDAQRPPTTTAQSRPPHVPGYLWDLYRELSGARAPWRAPPHTALVRNFFPSTLALEAPSPLPSPLPADPADLAALRLDFNLSSALTNDESLTSARLQLKAPPLASPADHSPTAQFRLSLFHLSDPSRGIARLLDTLVFSPSLSRQSPSQWLHLDVSSAVARALSHSEGQMLSLRLSVDLSAWAVGEGETEAVARELRPALLLFGSDASEAAPRRRRASQGPALRPSEASLVRRKRRTGGNRRRTGRRGRGGRRRSSALWRGLGWRHPRSVCRRWPLRVDFRELNWEDWILAPQGLDAFFCAGACVWPLPAKTAPSNHAVVQAMLHSVAPHKVPPPCCVPDQTDLVSILYIDIHQRIVIKNYPQMVVQGCACR